MKKVFQIKLKSITKVFAMVMALSLVTFTGCKSYDEDIDKLNTDLTSLSTQLTDLKTQTAANLDAKVAALNTQISDLTTRINTLTANSATKAELTAQIAALQTQITTLKVDGATKAELTAAINTLQTQYNTLLANSATKAELAAVEAELTSKLASKAELTAAENALIQKISDLQLLLEGKLDTLKAELINTLVSKSALEEYKSSMETRLSGIDSKIAALEAKKTVSPEELQAVKDELDGKIIATNTALSQLQASVTTLETSLTLKDAELATLIGQLDARVAVLEGLVALKADKSALDALATKVDGIQTALTNLTTKVGDNETAINNIKTTILTLATKAELDALDGKVDNAVSDIKDQITDINKSLKSLETKLGVQFQLLTRRLTSLEYVADLHVNGIQAMNFSPLFYQNCAEVNKPWTKIITPTVDIAFHMNPSTVTKEDIQYNNLTLKVIKSKNIFSSASVASGETRIKAYYKDITSDGQLIVSVKVDDYNALFKGLDKTASFETFYMAALEVQLAEKVLADNEEGDPELSVVTSEYVRLYSEELYTYTHVLLARKNPTTYTELPRTAQGAKDLTVNGVDNATSTSPVVVTLPYNTTLNLKDEVLPILVQGTSRSPLDFDKYKLSYKFDLLDESGNVIEYKRGSNLTDQQKFIEITNLANGTIKAKVFSASEIAASQGRTPIVRVRVFTNGDDTCPVLMGFVKILMADKPAPDSIVEEITVPSYTVGCEEWCSTVTDVEFMNTKVYNKAGTDGLSKDDFHTIYKLSTVTSIQGVTGTNNGGTLAAIVNGQQTETDLLRWCISPSLVWAQLTGTKTSVTFLATATYTPVLPTEYPVVKINFTVTINKPAVLNIPATEKISNYWYSNTAVSPNPYIKHNVYVAPVGTTNPNLAVFVNNINQAFEQTATKANRYLASNMPNSAYEYYFLPNTTNTPQQPVLTGVTGNNSRLVVSSDGKSLTYPGSTEVIATINNWVSGTGDNLTINKASTEAKRLMNIAPENLKVRIGIRGKFCADLQNIQNITIDGKEYFDVVIVRPINAEPVENDGFVDGRSLGQPGTSLEVRELIELSDWRHSSTNSSLFETSANYWYYWYYGVSSNSPSRFAHIPVSVDKANIKTNLNQTGTTQVLASLYPDLIINDLTTLGTYYLTYVNNSNVLNGTFNLYVPIKVTYTWGEITTVVTVPVNKTAGPAGVKRK